VFQAAHLLPTLTCEQNVALPLHLLGLPAREIDARVAQVLDEVSLRDRSLHLPDELSGGERQRVAVARALVTAPRLVLADEPTGSLDTTTGAQILQLFVDVQRTHRTTIVIVTHDHHAASHCGRIVRIRDGRIESDSAA
jgi:putative ABC transport system ATP-binding protein